jgi:O-antigen/teichoic acid export membrane protein
VTGRRNSWRLPSLWGIDLDYYVRGGGLLFLDYAATTAFGLLTTYCFTSFTSKDLYGSYSYVQSILGLAMLFALPGVENAVLRSTSRGFDGALVKGVALRLRFSVLGTLALWGAAVVFHVTGKREFAVACLASGVVFPGLYSFTDFRPYLRGRQWFRRYLAYGVGSTVIGAATTIGAVLARLDFTGILLANLVGRVVGTAVFTARLVPMLRNRDVDPEFVPFARNLSALAVLGTIVYHVDKLLIGTFLDMGTLAVYKLAWTLTEPIRTLGVFLSYLTFPRLVKAAGRPVYERFRRRVPIALALLVPVGVGSALVLPVVIRVLFPAYADATALLNWMIAGSCLAIALIYLDTFYVSQDRLQRVYYVNNVVRNAVMIALMAAMIRPWGALGVIWARLIARGISAAWLLARIYSGKDAPPNGGAGFRPQAPAGGEADVTRPTDGS